MIILEGADKDLYSPSSPLFGDHVNKAFPSSAGEIDEAGKCLALGRWTAAVMHLMRALELALKALQQELELDHPKEQWNQILDQCEAKIRKIKKYTHGVENDKWFSDVATQFRFIKDTWRNCAQHLHERYAANAPLAFFMRSELLCVNLLLG